MDGYEFTAKSYEEVLAKKSLEPAMREHLNQQIAALRVVAGKTIEEVDAIFNTGAFNEICKGYLKKALVKYGLDQEIVVGVMDEFKFLLDTITAFEARLDSEEAVEDVLFSDCVTICKDGIII